MFSVYQHWDPLKTCVVGRSYPPEFYSWIKVPHVRALFEKIAIETEEDYQKIVKKLEEFGVEVLRPVIYNEPSYYLLPNKSKYMSPPMTPRDYSVMIGQKFYHSFNKGSPGNPPGPLNGYEEIIKKIQDHGNDIINLSFADGHVFNGATISRIGKDLYFGTHDYDPTAEEIEKINQFTKKEFTGYRNHVIKTGGHGDGTFCPVCPGLIISLRDVPTYAETFPGWEVVYLPNQSWFLVSEFLRLKKKNAGKWWIPGFEDDRDVIDTVEQWLSHWTGYVEETVFDVNMLVVDPKNVLVFNYNQQVFDALDRYGMTAHIVPFRHRYFWDGGIHCITSDLDRQGSMQDYFKKQSDAG